MMLLSCSLGKFYQLIFSQLRHFEHHEKTIVVNYDHIPSLMKIPMGHRETVGFHNKGINCN